VLKLFAVTRHTAQGDPPISRWQFQKTFPYFTPHATKQETAGVVEQFGGGRPAAWRPVADFLHHYQLDGGYTPGPLLVLFAVAGLFGAAISLLARRLERRTREPALACLLFFGSALFLLLVSDVFVFSWRYQLPALVTLVPAGALGLAVIIDLIRARRSSA
jgi:hypothetical protein